jgi:hypothetical protein
MKTIGRNHQIRDNRSLGGTTRLTWTGNCSSIKEHDQVRGGQIRTSRDRTSDAEYWIGERYGPNSTQQGYRGAVDLLIQDDGCRTAADNLTRN